MGKKRIYISGQMTGIPRRVYLKRFDRAAEYFKSAGYKVTNPARGIGVFIYYLLGRKVALRYDLWLLSRCDYIYMLAGWKNSQGAKLEHDTAVRMHKKVIRVHYESF